MRRYALAGVAVAGLIAISGCSDQSAGGESSTNSSVSVTTSTSASASSEPNAASVVINIVVKDGTITADKPSPKIKIGETVEVIVTADVDDEVHNHLNNESAAIRDGKATLQFVADKPGIYEIELEGSGQVLLELRIS